MAHLKNYRGATNYFFPANQDYRDNYDRIFGKKDKATAGACEHEFAEANVSKDMQDVTAVCTRCGTEVVLATNRP